MTMKRISLAALVLATSCALPALAQSWYIGGGIGRGNLDQTGNDIGLPNGSIGDSATTYTLRLGYRLTPYFAVEGAYYDLGEYDFSGSIGNVGVAGTAKAKAFALNAVGILPLSEAFDLYGRIGYGEAELKANASALGFVANNSDRQSGAFYGVGARWNATRNWGIFAEWMKADKIEVDSYIVGVDYRF
jgi:OOP family OmpA-OmpF porin